MSEQEFPPELVDRCTKAVRRNQFERTSSGRAFDPDVPPTESEILNTLAVLRESGYADLVAALKVARMYVEEGETEESYADLASIDDALRKAGAA